LHLHSRQEDKMAIDRRALIGALLVSGAVGGSAA
jgi:hypothetical protein